MQYQPNRSATIGKLAEALSKAQGAIRNAPKSSKNPFYHSNYADLASVWDACREQLSANGLCVIQLATTASAPNRIALETILAHSSGEWIGSHLEMQPLKTDPQAFGSAITYARRYGLQAIVGIAAEDDDGNEASVKVQYPKATKETYEANVARNRAAAAWSAPKEEPGTALGKSSPDMPEEPTEEDLESPAVTQPDTMAPEEARQAIRDAFGTPLVDEIPKEKKTRRRGPQEPTGPVPEACPKCGSPIGEYVSNSKTHPGRRYMACSWAYGQRMRLVDELGAKPEEAMGAVADHFRAWKEAK